MFLINFLINLNTFWDLRDSRTHMDALNQFTSKLMKFMNIFLLNLALYGPHAQLRFPSSSQGCLAARLAYRPAGALLLPASRSFGLDALVLAFLTLWLSTQQALTILMGLWRRRQWWRRRRPLKAKRSLSIRKPAGVAWQHALLYNSRKLATVAPPLAAHAACSTAARAIWRSLSKAVRGY